MIDELDLYWLAGLLEGEGSFTPGTPRMPNKPIISLKSTDEDVVARAAALLKVSYQFQNPPSHEGKNWKSYYSLRIAGKRATDFMKLLYPIMGMRRQAQIQRALACYNGDERYVLSGERLEALKRRLQAGEHVLSLAKEYGVSKSYAYSLKKQL